MQIKLLIPFLKKSIIFVIGFLVIILLLETTINSFVKLINVGEYGILNKIDKGTINADILISGSSRALKAINPEIIEDLTKKTCFNIASDGSDLGVQFAKLKWYLDNNKKPEIIIQDVSQFGGGISKNIYEPFKYIPYLNNDSLYKYLYCLNEDIWYNKFIYPSNLIYYNFDFYVKLFSELLNSYKNKNSFINGYLPDDSKWAGNLKLLKETYPEGMKHYLSKEFKNYLNNLVDFCKMKGIKLYLVIIPNFYLLNNKEENIANKYYSSLSDSNKIIFLNFANISLAKNTNYFYNFTHLNTNGATHFSKILVTYFNF